MKQSIYHTEDARWLAVETRDANADEQFVFGVITTGIFCRPSCRARHPLRQNVRFYQSADAAQAAGFRPCKRCQPDKAPLHQQRVERIRKACALLDASEQTLTLDALAQEMALSTYHFHRLFKSVTGMTPKAWQTARRNQRLRSALTHGEAVTPALYQAGFGSGSSFYRDADAALGMTAKQFRSGGKQLSLRYAMVDCHVGRCLVAQSPRGICAVLLGDGDAELETQLAALFPLAERRLAQDDFSDILEKVVACIRAPDTRLDLPLDFQGTLFQQQVWEALRTIPSGETVSYQALAAKVGKPNAVRAVASACGANRLAIIVPCHRVIRRDGQLSGYRWGVARKAALLQHEAKKET
ncbi:bifunctional DNA-binding transcriptional regulator/O6-methylguanine-DNA methyltransferase Ada [Atlantibacter hermannii]|nr:bifunctional DNA-binding transcriptional regulator/O6-methylguanine-DNA methyltransferase Ada [Atlantibacter hermannii]NBC99846.1 bifunctional DNA-binding transcriptional regulator/O6-methylguanine-DNA methyltransferase Ada [Atlantibacter hermannii]